MVREETQCESGYGLVRTPHSTWKWTMPGEVAYVNGKIGVPAQSFLPIDDRACTFGDGVYEVIRVYGGRMFAAYDHARRLWASARGIRLRLPWEREEEFIFLLDSLVRRSELPEAVVYVQVSRGVAPRAHGFDPGLRPSVVVTVRPRQGFAYPEEGLRVITKPDLRWGMCRIKSLNLLPNVLCYQEAREMGCQEALLVGQDGYVNEGTSSSFFAVFDGVVRTAGLDRNILAGITRERLIRVARELGVPVVEEPVAKAELVSASEAFVTSTNMEVQPVVSIDGAPVGSGRPGTLTKRLREAFREHVQRELAEGA